MASSGFFYFTKLLRSPSSGGIPRGMLLTLVVAVCWRHRFRIPDSGLLFCLAELLCVSHWQSPADHPSSATRLKSSKSTLVDAVLVTCLGKHEVKTKLGMRIGSQLWMISLLVLFPSGTASPGQKLNVKKKFHKQHAIL